MSGNCFVRSISMFTDHTYHGHPKEVTRIDLYVDTDFVDEKGIELLKRMQEKRLHSMAKNMPHTYWLNRAKGTP